MAYAFRQEETYEKLGLHFEVMWEPLRQHADALLLSHDIPLELELRVQQDAEERATAPMTTTTGRDVDDLLLDEDQWGLVHEDD